MEGRLPSLKQALAAVLLAFGLTGILSPSGLLAFSSSPPLARQLEPLGWYDPGTPGLNASVAGLDGIAFLGSWGSESDCPALGVRLVDVSNPAAPAPIASAAAYPGTSAEHVAALRMDTSAFVGSVLLAGIQRCGGRGGVGGLVVWDVSDPANPRELSYVATGGGPGGVHEFGVGRLGERWYAYLAVPYSDLYDGRGDLRVVDFTDPSNPVEVATWSAPRDAGLPVGHGEQCAPYCRGRDATAYLHSVTVSPDGRLAYLSYWDLGMIVLDVSEPARPRLLGRFAEPQEAEGNTHSVAIAHNGELGLVADETLAPPWGHLRLVDLQHPAEPVQIGMFETPNSNAGRAGGPLTWYSIHHPLVDDRDPNRAYLAWFSDGVRVVDIRNGSAPVELESWVPPSNPLVWSVALMGDLLLVGDINNGLYVLRRSY
jgi:hypothetical protein